MALVTAFSGCCGASIYFGLSVDKAKTTPELEFFKTYVNSGGNIITFIDAEQWGAGNAVWKLLKKKDWGRCTRSRLMRSNHGGDTLRVFVWAVDNTKRGEITKWVNENTKKVEPPKPAAAAAQPRAW